MKQHLRVLYVDGSVGFGGAIKSLALTLRHLPDVEALILTAQDRDIVETWLRGHQVWPFRRIMNYRTMGRARSWLKARLRFSVIYWPLLKSISAADELVKVKNALWLSWFLRRHQVDLVHLNNDFGPIEVLVAARLTGTPCVVHLRGFEKDRGKPTPYAMRRAAHVITCSSAVAVELQQKTSIPQQMVTAIHDPVDLERMERATISRDEVRRHYGLGPSDVVMGIFGRVITWKGQLIFVKAAIRAMYQSPALRAVIVGDQSDGGSEYFKHIMGIIRESGLEGRFILAGYVSDVERWYAAVDVVVHASVSAEPFGMVVPEALAARKAVIAADAGGPREVLTHGVDGLLTPPGDVDALVEAMIRLAGDPQERERLAENGYRMARARFGLELNAKSVRSVYDNLLSRTPVSDMARM